jgi:hypothetical protein
MFRDVPPAAVKRENIKEFFRWAFLNTDMDDPTYDDEVEGCEEPRNWNRDEFRVRTSRCKVSKVDVG